MNAAMVHSQRMATNYFGEDSSWRLWPDPAPREDLVFEVPAPAHDAVVSDVFRPRMFLFRAEKPNGSAALVLAGGGYTKLVIGKEGVEVARWLNALGIHAFVLAHRFPGRSGSQAPVDDAIEAMRQIRARAGEWGIDTDKVGACGLSSGGHLASCLVARYPDVWRATESPHAHLQARPDFLVVGYAPISTNASGRTVVPDKKPLLPPEKQALYEVMQPDLQLVEQPPPAFIAYSATDEVVPMENAYRLHQALIKKGGSAELHVFADAPHGFALREKKGPVAKWPELCAEWLRSMP